MQRACMTRRPWNVSFAAEPEGVAALRRLTHMTLEEWGLHSVSEAAQLCVGELVSNVITHVGNGIPAALGMRMSGTCLRIEVHDPDLGSLPTVVAADSDAESGRGMALVEATADRWGVQLHSNGKVTWCELATGLSSPTGHTDDPRVDRVEALVGLYQRDRISWNPSPSLLVVHATTEAAVELMADVLHWLRAHGRDADTALDRAQMRFESVLLSEGNSAGEL